MAASSWCTVTTTARSEDVLVSCWMFHLMVKAHAFHRHARSCILFSKYPNQKSQIVPKGYKICVFQKVDAFHHWETFKRCVQISNTEVARKQFLSLTFFLVCFTVVYAQGFAFLYWWVTVSKLPPPCCTETSMYWKSNRHHQQPALREHSALLATVGSLQ